MEHFYIPCSPPAGGQEAVMWYIYALYNKENKKFYIGYTNNLERRLKEHNEKRGRHYTAKYEGTWILIYKEQVDSKKEALIREKQLKSFRGREFIRKIIIEGSAPL